MKRIGALVLLVGSALVLLVFASSAVAWQTTQVRDDGTTAHQWILGQAIELAQSAGADWVDAPTALAAVDDPDTVLRDFRYHSYDRWGGRRGGAAPTRVAANYASMLDALYAGDTVAASRLLGLTVHYYADVCNPLHTDGSRQERRMHVRYETRVTEVLNADSSNRLQRCANYASRVEIACSVGVFTARAARDAHRQYRMLVRSFNRHGFGGTTARLSATSLRRAVEGAAAIIVKAHRDKDKPRPSPTPTPSATPEPTASPTSEPSVSPTAQPIPTPSASGSPAPTPAPSPSPSSGPYDASVTAYGAKGDGVSDDTAAVRAALSAVAARGGGTVFVPAGDYRVSSLAIPAGVSLAGAGMDRSWLHGAVTPSSTLTLSDLKLGVAGASLRFSDGAHDALLLRCRIVGGPPAISFTNSSASRITFRGCVIDAGRGAVANAVTVGEYSGGATVRHYEDIVWEDCHFLGSTRMTVEITHRATSSTGKGYRNISFLRCVFEPSDSQVISYDAVPVGTLGIVSGYSRVEGCVIKGAGANPSMSWPHGLEINGPRGMVVKDNTFYACRGSALNFHGSQGDDARPLGWVTVTGNTFDMTRGATPHAAVNVVNANGSGTVIRDNTFTVNTGGQVFLLYGARNLIENNTVTDTRATSNGVLFDLDGAPDNTIRGNTLRGQGARVSVRAGSSGNVFANNTFETGRTEATLYGIAAGVTITRTGNIYR